MTSQAIKLNDYESDLLGRKAVVETHESNYESKILVGSVEIIERLFDEWTNLCEEGASDEPFLRPEWFSVFVEKFESEVLFLIVRRAGKLRAILPLVRETESLHGVPTRKLRAVFNLQSPRTDLIHGADAGEREAIIKAVWREMKKISGWDVWEMRLVKEGSWLGDLLKIAEAEKHRTGIWKMDSAPFVSLPQADDKKVLIENYFKGLSKNRRQLLKKKRRYLEELGAVETCVTRGYSDELMQKYFALEAQSWKGRAGTAVGCDEKVERLHDEFARAVADRNALFIHELKLDGKTIAMYLSIMFERRTIGWKMSYDENYAKYSPGNLLFIEVLNECMRNGSPELDQLSPATYNKSMWATGEYEHAALYIFRRGIVGAMLYRWTFSVVSRLRKYKNRTPKTASEIN